MKLLPRLAVFSLFVFISCSSWVSSADLCGGNKVANTIIVGQPAGRFKTVQAAIDSIKNKNAQWVKIHIKAGTYKEKVLIPNEKPCIILEGEGRGVTTITYNDHQQTDTSATFTSYPNYVIVKGITFKNSFNLAAALRLHQGTRGSKVIRQALAARIYGDKSAFFDCGFAGFQDTLWDVKGRHYFKNCYIEGAIDFIFGNGQSYYEDCVLNVTLSTHIGEVSSGFITAQGRGSQGETSGFVFSKGSVVGRGGKAMLGRAYGPYSRVIFYGTYLDSVVAPAGWDAWHHAGHEGNLVYAEVECRGPGANTKNRVPWEKKLSGLQLKQFSRSSFIDQDGWLAKLPIK